MYLGRVGSGAKYLDTFRGHCIFICHLAVQCLLLITHAVMRVDILFYIMCVGIDVEFLLIIIKTLTWRQ